MSLISVIIPAYNAEKTIGSCLQALSNQTYPAEQFEVIVVDDGSTDGTAEEVRQFPIRYFYQKNQGPAAARNNGAGKASGSFILFTDSDCIPKPSWVEEMIRPFENPEVVAVKGAYCNRQKSVVARFAQLEFEERFEMLKKSASIDMVDTYSAAFRKDIFLELKGFDTRFPCANNEDTELSYRMSKLGYTMVFNPQAVVEHLNHPASIRHYGRLKFGRGYWRMLVYREFPEKAAKDSYTPQTLKLQILFLFLMLASLPVIFLLPAFGLALPVLMGTLLIVSMMPFIGFAMKRDLVVGLCSPGLLVLRAAAIGSGACCGLISSKLK